MGFYEIPVDIRKYFFCIPRAFRRCRGAAEGNKHGRGEIVTDCIPKKPYLNCFIVPIQYIFVRLFTLVDFLITMRIVNLTLPCLDYAMVRHLSLNNFCRNLVKTLFILDSRRNKCFIAYVFFILITDSQIRISCYFK